uniref:UBA domain-containing protein n=1 Tax=Fagus sylvatica TaxID=28930 RepID=A0A2N9E5Y6_FAGSY
MTFQQALLSQLGRQQPTQEQGQAAGGTEPHSTVGKLVSLSFALCLSLPPPSVSPVLSPLLSVSHFLHHRYRFACICFALILFIFPVPPEELYATQLSQLQEMGFFDTQENIRALIATAGNVHAAVERLLGNSGQ